jgi:ferredoxin
VSATGEHPTIFPTEPVTVLPVDEIIRTAGPLLGQPTDRRHHRCNVDDATLAELRAANTAAWSRNATASDYAREIVRTSAPYLRELEAAYDQLKAYVAGFEFWGSDCTDCGSATPGSMRCEENCPRDDATLPLFIRRPDPTTPRG